MSAKHIPFTAAAIYFRHDGLIFTAPSHCQAFDKAWEHGKDLDQADFGFIDENGIFYSIEDAERLTGQIVTSEDL